MCLFVSKRRKEINAVIIMKASKRTVYSTNISKNEFQKRKPIVLYENVSNGDKYFVVIHDTSNNRPKEGTIEMHCKSFSMCPIDFELHWKTCRKSFMTHIDSNRIHAQPEERSASKPLLNIDKNVKQRKYKKS